MPDDQLERIRSTKHYRRLIRGARLFIVGVIGTAMVIIAEAIGAPALASVAILVGFVASAVGWILTATSMVRFNQDVRAYVYGDPRSRGHPAVVGVLLKDIAWRGHGHDQREAAPERPDAAAATMSPRSAGDLPAADVRNRMRDARRSPAYATALRSARWTYASTLVAIPLYSWVRNDLRAGGGLVLTAFIVVVAGGMVALFRGMAVRGNVERSILDLQRTLGDHDARKTRRFFQMEMLKDTFVPGRMRREL